MTEAHLVEIRASIYWWFATLLSKELTQSQFTGYANSEGANLLNQLALEPMLRKDVDAIKQSLAKLNLHKHPYLECKAEFSQLFLMDNKTGAPPYASIYLSEQELMFQQAHNEMVALLKQQGLAIVDEFNEPADHIAIQLDYLGNLVLATLQASDSRQVCKQQLDFIENKILIWLPLFLARMTRINNSGFYQNICQLLHSYLLLEVELLRDNIKA
ncbi:molecular chaperone TorD [Thalassotalea maritima]|uniref:molecular chaperone TorD n=1 Tax=Thalassotalea maritima TaxID=3242416 RepID=UPI0035275249